MAPRPLPRMAPGQRAGDDLFSSLNFMSEIAPITVSLELAKKLKEAGWQYETLFFWCGLEHKEVSSSTGEMKIFYGKYYPYREHFAAPTAEEILRRLPHGTDTELIIKRKPKGTWRVTCTGDTIGGDTLANAAAAMFCFLSENNLLPINKS